MKFYYDITTIKMHYTFTVFVYTYYVYDKSRTRIYGKVCCSVHDYI